MPRCQVVLLFLLSAISTAALADDQRRIPGWGDAVDIDGDCEFALDDGKLTITAPGPAHDLSAELHLMNAPRIVRDVEGDFVAEVKVSGTFDPGEPGLLVRTPYNGAGLLLMADERTYLRIERATLVARGERRPYTNFELRVDGRVQRFGRVDDFALDEESPTWLRLERRGGTIYGAVAQTEGAWHYLGSKSAELPATMLIGVAAVNASTKPFSPEFERFEVYVRQSSDAEPPPATDADDPEPPRDK